MKREGYLGKGKVEFDKPNVKMGLRFTLASLLILQFIFFYISLFFTDLAMVCLLTSSFLIGAYGLYLWTKEVDG